MSDPCWTRFEHALNVNISGMKMSIKFSFSIQIKSYSGASDRQMKNWQTLLLRYMDKTRLILTLRTPLTQWKILRKELGGCKDCKQPTKYHLLKGVDSSHIICLPSGFIRTKEQWDTQYISKIRHLTAFSLARSLSLSLSLTYYSVMIDKYVYINRGKKDTYTCKRVLTNQ